MIGFEAHNIWRIYHSSTREIVRVRDVIFQENCLYKNDEKTPREFLDRSLNRWIYAQHDGKLSSFVSETKIEEFESPNVMGYALYGS